MASPWDVFGDDDAPTNDESSEVPPSSPPDASAVTVGPAGGSAGVADDKSTARVKSIIENIYGFVNGYGAATAEDLSKIGGEDQPELTTEALLLQPAVARMLAALSQLRASLASSQPGAPALFGSHLLEVSTLIIDRTWLWLQGKGSWPHVAMREAFVCAQLSKAAAQAVVPSGDPTLAMRAVDMALILGAPPTETRPIVEAVEGWYLETVKASSSTGGGAGTGAGAGGGAAVARPVIASGAAATLPLVPAVLRSDATLHLPPSVLAAAETLRQSPGAAMPGLVTRIRVRPRDPKRPLYQKPTDEHPLLSALRTPAAGPAMPVSEFRTRFVKGKQPVAMSCAVDDWPAMTRWRDLRGLHSRFGHRTVPVEVGTHMTSSWKEAAMPLSDFLSRYMAPSIGWGWGKGGIVVDQSLPAEGPDSIRTEGPRGAATVRLHPSHVAYLAQHGLLEQIPGLAADMDMPLYAGGEDGQVGAANAWFGTAGTVTRAHFDSYDNTFVQVFGYKFVRLYPPSDSDKLYPYRGSMAGPAQGKGKGKDETAGKDAAGGSGDATTSQGNVSSVDVECDPADPDVASRFPAFAQAQPLDVVLGPGDSLFIPQGWWHYVRSLTPSFSVNFWY